MNQLQIFKNPEFGAVRTVEIDGEPWLVGKDVAEALGYENQNRDIVRHVDEDDRKNVDSKTQYHFGIELGQRGGWLINESGLYSLVLSSKLPTARRFRRWVTSEVLPAIRKHGMYAVDELLDNPDIAIQAFTRLKEERAKTKALSDQIEADAPKVIFANSVEVSKTSILVFDLAKIIRQNGVNIGGNRLFDWMRENGYLVRRRGTDWNMPTQRAMELGLFEVKETSVSHADGHVTVSRTPKVTGKGQIYFVNKFLTRNRNGGTENA